MAIVLNDMSTARMRRDPSRGQDAGHEGNCENVVTGRPPTVFDLLPVRGFLLFGKCRQRRYAMPQSEPLAVLRAPCTRS